MLRSISVWLLSLFVTVVPAIGATPEPTVFTAGDAVVRSGPGEQFYATSLLSAGEPIEVYRRRDDGWCAIRPPDESFSYVRADHVRLTELSDVLEVVVDGAKTRVGSALASDHQVEYVTLKRGERLQLIGGPIRLGSSGQVWYPIAPPAGEFRWIHEHDLSSSSVPSSSVPSISQHLELPAAIIPAPQPPGQVEHIADGRPAVDAASQAAASRSPPATEPPRQGVALEKLKSSGGQMQTEPIPRVVNEPDAVRLATHTEPVAEDRGTQNEQDQLDRTASEPTQWTAVDGAAAAGRPHAAAPIGETNVANAADPDVQLSELELTLSQMVTQEMGSWDLATLHARVQQMAQRVSSTAGRQQAIRLLERIEEFAALQHRHQQLMDADTTGPGDMPSPTANVSPPIESRASRSDVASLPPAPRNPFFAREAAIRRQAEDVHYAGQGWLVPVISSQPNLPGFALTNEQGTILAFVSPRPGLNLRRYQRRRVGIVGRETARIGDEAPHLLADRVIVLKRHDRY